jgi:hypothetical protein
MRPDGVVDVIKYLTDGGVDAMSAKHVIVHISNAFALWITRKAGL